MISPTPIEDWPGCILYRHAYGLAVRLAGARHEFGIRPGREGVNAAAGGKAAAIREAVASELGRVDRLDRAGLALIEEAVDDAMMGRQPAW